MPYPLEQLSADAPDEEKQRAMEATIQQLLAEGLPEAEAQAKAAQMVAKSPSSTQPVVRSKTVTRQTALGYATGDSGMAGGTASNQFRSVLNDRLNNFNPIRPT